VVVSARSQAPLEALAEELRRDGAQADAVVADIGEDEGLAALGGLPAIDILVYAAGSQSIGGFASIPDAEFKRLFDVNVMGAVKLTRRLLPWMRDQGWGRIINISSIAGQYGSINQTPYNTTKHALLGFTKSLALETGADGVTVNAICPGAVETEMFLEALPRWAEERGVTREQMLEGFISRIPIGRMMKPSEVADLVVYLASPGAAAMTGQGITLDGGLMHI
jgi:NAD(P)-dependent dehydrogenase (short-subunit alcohol dehydrogenase family)